MSRFLILLSRFQPARDLKAQPIRIGAKDHSSKLGGSHDDGYKGQKEPKSFKLNRESERIPCSLLQGSSIKKGDTYTLIERKLRMLRLQGVKGLAVVVYAESLTTQQMRYHRLSRRVNKMESFF